MAALASAGEPDGSPRAPSFSVETPEAWSASRPAKPASGADASPPAKETTWLR